MAAILSLLLVAACGADPAPTATPATPAPTASPTASPSPSASPGSTPGTVDPAAYDEIERQVVELRGLEPTRPVEREILDEPGLRAHLVERFDRKNPAEYVANTETLYRSLLLLDDQQSLGELYVDLYTSQVLGFYDQDSGKMYLVVRDGEIGPVDRITYAHEYTHALQDQAFGLAKLLGENRDQGDRSLARRALAEGDGVLLMSLWANQHLTPAELAEAIGAADPASGEVLARMPAILKDPLMFPYMSGLTLALGDFATGGYAAVDGRYANPPDSTEQVIHPEKLAAREVPVPVALPDDLATRLGTGWEVALQDTFGEFGLELLLRDAGGADSSVSQAAAAGWGGDRLALVRGPGGATGTVIDTAWDTDADAGEYASALASLAQALQAAGRSAQVLTPAPERVVLVTGDSADTVGRLANALGLAG